MTRTAWVTDGLPLGGVAVTVSVGTDDPETLALIERSARMNGIELRRVPSLPDPYAAFLAGARRARFGPAEGREGLPAGARDEYDAWVASGAAGPPERERETPVVTWSSDALQVAAFTYRRAWWELTDHEIQAAWDAFWPGPPEPRP